MQLVVRAVGVCFPFFFFFWLEKSVSSDQMHLLHIARHTHAETEPRQAKV